MSSSNVTIPSDSQNEINTINSFIVSWARLMYPIIFVFGVVCNILNIYVLTRPALRRNPCCMYFLFSSIAALIYTIINVPLRTLQMGYNTDPTAYLHSSSNVNRRGWSSFKVASRVIPITLFLVHLAYAHVPVFYEILLPRRSCSIGNGFYAIFLGIWHLITYGTGPPLLMLVFSLLTIQHVRRRRIMPVNNQSNQGRTNANKDRNLLRMALFQCLVVGSTTTAYALNQWYATLTANEVKSSLQLAKDDLLTNLLGSITTTGLSTTFFIFILSSQLFRQQLFCRRQERK